MHSRCVALEGMFVRAQAPAAFLAGPGGLAGRVRAPAGINGNLFQTVHLISTFAGAASAFAAREQPGGAGAKLRLLGGDMVPPFCERCPGQSRLNALQVSC